MTATASARIGPRLPFMPCCGRNSSEPGNVIITGWALIPDRIACGCGAVWDVVDHHEVDTDDDLDDAYTDIRLKSLPDHPIPAGRRPRRSRQRRPETRSATEP